MTVNIEKWKMSFDTHKSLPCTVPCSMYSVLPHPAAEPVEGEHFDVAIAL